MISGALFFGGFFCASNASFLILMSFVLDIMGVYMRLRCSICPRACLLADLEVGDCSARQRVGGKIVSLAYGKPCSIAIDPMEKKPLFHFYPGSDILSLGMAGCNLHCKNCQNYSISQANPKDVGYKTITPQQVVDLMLASGLKSVAYTYTEPLVAFEYVLECAKLVAAVGGQNVLVTAAYVNLEPLEELLPYIHAANVDLKSMNPKFYQNQCKASLAPVLEAIKCIKAAGICLEVTNLIVPTLNDTVEDISLLVDFVVNQLGVEVPLHFSRFFPMYLQENLPPTPVQSLYQARAIALEAGLKHVYIGNLRSEMEVTACSKCSKALIKRDGYRVIDNLLRDGLCPVCATPLYGRFEHADTASE